MFHVGVWGFGFKDVINFGIGKILNIEEEKKPIEKVIQVIKLLGLFI